MLIVKHMTFTKVWLPRVPTAKYISDINHAREYRKNMSAFIRCQPPERAPIVDKMP